MIRWFFGAWKVAIPLLVMIGAAFSDPVVTRKNTAAGVTLPLFGADRTRPATLVKMGQLGIGAQRQGFFRIGVLPEVTARDVWFVFQMNDATALADLPAALQALTKTSSIELFEVKMLAPGASDPWLTATRVKVDAKGAWELSGVRLQAGTVADKARLIVHGDEAGTLSIENNSTKIQLFAP